MPEVPPEFIAAQSADLADAMYQEPPDLANVEVPDAIRRPVTVATRLVVGIISELGWQAPPTLIVALWARRSPLNTPDRSDVTGQVSLLEPRDGTEGAFEMTAALRDFGRFHQPKVPAGRLFHGLVVATAGLATHDEDAADMLLSAKPGADAAAVHDDLAAQGRIRQYITAVGCLVDGWRFETSRYRDGGSEFAYFAPDQSWVDSHAMADAVVDTTATINRNLAA